MRSLSDTFDQLRDVIQRPQRLGTKVLLAGGVQFCPQLVQIGQVGLDLFGRGQAMLTQEVGQQVLDWGCQLKCGGGVGNRLDDAKSQQLLDDMCRGGGAVCGGRRDQATQVSLGEPFPAMEKILQQWIIVGGKSKKSLGIGGHQQVSVNAC